MSMVDLFQTGYHLYDQHPVTGIRTGIVKENYHPEYEGQVKVEILLREEGANVTEWARVASPYAGKNRGLFLLPEIGDEVLVVFDSGDIHRPIVVGSLWNAKSDPPPSGTHHPLNQIKQFKTKGGHQVTFQEIPGKTSVEIRTPGKHALLLDDERQSIRLENEDGSNSIEINEQTGVISIKGAQAIFMDTGGAKLRLDAHSNKAVITSDTIELEGARALTLKAPSMSIQSASLEISSAADLNLHANGAVSLRGTIIKLN
jgi:uncharacterized protein involved in type VI secretion and phage assembly